SKKDWRTYAMAVWMIAVSGFLYHLNGKVEALRQTSLKLSSDVDSVESILISTDSNVADVKKQVDVIHDKMAVVHRRVMRRR
ncbi:MAG: hypothetical protein CR984_01875, partial [Proteobacteria bacterium]